jgi:hypothetical protein
MIYTANEARELGFTIDESCYPWLAYKGPRYAPSDRLEVLTDLEAELRDALKEANPSHEVLAEAEKHFRCRREKPNATHSRSATGEIQLAPDRQEPQSRAVGNPLEVGQHVAVSVSRPTKPQGSGELHESPPGHSSQADSASGGGGFTDH